MVIAEKIFNILELFLENKYELSLSELVKLSGLSPAVVHRIVTFLVKRGYLIQKGRKGKYTLGLKFLNYTYIIHKNIKLIDIAMPFLLELNKKTGESVLLGSLNEGQSFAIERIETDHELRVSGPVGKEMSLYSTSLGKVFLSQMSESEKKAVFNNKNFKKYTKNTVTDLSRMKKEFDFFENKGLFYDREEHMIGIWSVAAPVYNSSGKIEAGISLLVPTPRMNPKKEQKYSQLIKSYAVKISQALGYER